MRSDITSLHSNTKYLVCCSHPIISITKTIQPMYIDSESHPKQPIVPSAPTKQPFSKFFFKTNATHNVVKVTATDPGNAHIYVEQPTVPIFSCNNVRDTDLDSTSLACPMFFVIEAICTRIAVDEMVDQQRCDG